MGATDCTRQAGSDTSKDPVTCNSNHRRVFGPGARARLQVAAEFAPRVEGVQRRVRVLKMGGPRISHCSVKRRRT